MGEAKGVDSAKPAELFPESLIWAIVTVFVVGLGAAIGLMAVMKDVFGFHPGLIIAFTLLCFLLSFMVEGVLIWQLLRHRGGVKAAGAAAPSKEQATKELDATPERLLPEPVPSVSEHTTRSFEPIYSERKSR